MRALVGAAAVLVFSALLAGCAAMGQAPVVPPQGLGFTDYSAPLDIDCDKTQLGTKRGEASTSSILALIATGDASIQAAARNGQINTINHVDYRFLSILGLYTKFTTVVYGD